MSDITGATGAGDEIRAAAASTAVEARNVESGAATPRRIPPRQDGAQAAVTPTEGAAASNAGLTSLAPEDSVLVKGIDSAQETSRQVRETLKTQAEAASEKIRAQPLASAGVVFAAGLLFGMLMNRPRA